MENTVESLQSELDFYRQNQSTVEQEIRTVIADNEKLSQQVGSLMKERIQTQQCLDHDQAQEVLDLRRQVALITKERDSLHVLWQTSQKTIEALDTELKAYQQYDNRNGKQNFNDENRDLELKLETALSDYLEIEANFKKTNLQRNYFETEIKRKDKELNSYKAQCENLQDKVEELKKELDGYKINLMAEKKNNDDVKKQLTSCQKEAIERVKKEAEAKTKVAEALQLYDVVNLQKNEALKSVCNLTQEVTKVKQTLATVRTDIETGFRRELEEVRDKYNEKVNDMLEHVRNLDSELVEKGLLLNKALREIKILQAANESYLKQQSENAKVDDPKLSLLEQRLEAMFQELVSSERRNIQLVCEKQALAFDIQRVQDSHTRETKRRDWEEKLLKTQGEELRRRNQCIDNKTRQFKKYLAYTGLKRLQVDHLQKSLNETHEMINTLQNMMSSRTELNQKMVTSKEGELLELNKHLEKQMELNKKWKESYIDMTEKLKMKLEALYKENKDLRIKLNLPHSSSTDSLS